MKVACTKGCGRTFSDGGARGGDLEVAERHEATCNGKRARRSKKKPKIEVRCEDPRGFPFRCYVDGVEVGLGSRRECDALAEELREKPEAARVLRDDMAAMDAATAAAKAVRS